MSNVLDNDTQQQILALGRLGWSLRRIEQALAVRRETISGYLKAAGIAVHGRGRRSEAHANRLDEVAGLDRDELTGVPSLRSCVLEARTKEASHGTSCDRSRWEGIPNLRAQ